MARAGNGEATQRLDRLLVGEKMHLRRLDFGVKNSIVAAQERRNNFLFAPVE
jgi:hypothetical protein